MRQSFRCESPSLEEVRATNARAADVSPAVTLSASIGIGSAKAGSPAVAAGCKTSTACHGKSRRRCCRSCCKDENDAKSDAVMQAMLNMTKLDMRALQEAYDLA